MGSTETPLPPPHLFLCGLSRVAGDATATKSSMELALVPVHCFTQGHLGDEEVAILDLWHSLYVWFGKGSRRQKRRLAFRAATTAAGKRRLQSQTLPEGAMVP